MRKSELGDPIIVASACMWDGYRSAFQDQYVEAHRDRFRDVVYVCWRGLECWVALYFWLASLDGRFSLFLVRRGIWQTREEGGYFRDCSLSPVRYWFRGRRLPRLSGVRLTASSFVHATCTAYIPARPRLATNGYSLIGDHLPGRRRW